MSENISIHFPNQCGIQSVDDLKRDLEPFCNTPRNTGRSSTHDTMVKKSVEPEGSSGEETDEDETSKSVKVSENGTKGRDIKTVALRRDHETQNATGGYKKYYENEYRTSTYQKCSGNSSMKYRQDDVEKEEENVWKKVGSFALKTAVISGAVLGGMALALPAMGFEKEGPRANSLASRYQSRNYGDTTPAGSTFSRMQRAGMVGLPSETIGWVVAGSAAVAAIASLSKEKKN